MALAGPGCAMKLSGRPTGLMSVMCLSFFFPPFVRATQMVVLHASISRPKLWTVAKPGSTVFRIYLKEKKKGSDP